MIYLRNTVNGRRAELSTGRKVHPNKWNSSTMMVQGFSPEVRQPNVFLNKMRTDIYKQAEKLRERDLPVTAIAVRDAYLGKDQEYKMLLEIFQEHNDQVDRLIGKDFAAGTAERYKTARKHLKDYINLEYKRNDIPVREVDHASSPGLNTI